MTGDLGRCVTCGSVKTIRGQILDFNGTSYHTCRDGFHDPRRYHVGYNRPVKDAIGDSPREWYTYAETDDLERARIYVKNVLNNGHSSAIIFDTHTNQVVTETPAYSTASELDADEYDAKFRHMNREKP